MVRLKHHKWSPSATEFFEWVNITGIFCLGNALQDATRALSAWGTKFHSHDAG